MSRRLLRGLAVRMPQLQDAALAFKQSGLNAVRKPFEPEFEILRALAHAGHEMALDIGANRGQSIDAIRLYLPTIRIVGFEPQPGLAEKLASRTATDANLEIRNCALGRAEAELTIFTPYYGEYCFDGLASLDRESASNWLGAKTLAGFDAKRLRIEEHRAQVKVLDGENVVPAFVKIDVQGAERDVLAGGQRTIAVHRPVLLMETGRDEALVEEIGKLGYAAYNYVRKRLVPRMRALRNTVFVHPAAPRGMARLIALEPGTSEPDK